MKNIIISEKLEKQSTSPPLILFTDIDDTYVHRHNPTLKEREKYSQKDLDCLLENSDEYYKPTLSHQ